MVPAVSTRTRLAVLVLAGAPCIPLAAAAQEPGPPTGEPLSGFERLIGTWAAGETVQTFEWGVGRRVVRARSALSTADGGSRLVSEGIFLHDPLRREVRGYFVAIDMPVAYFEYTARWGGEALIAHLTTTDPDGTPRRYIERWELIDEDRFRWSLREDGDADAPAVMSAEFQRVTTSEPEAEPADSTGAPGGASGGIWR